MRWLAAMMLAAAAPIVARAAAPAPQPSVLVTTVTPRTGTIARTVVGYGVVQSAPGGSQTLSVLLATQVRQVMVGVGQTVQQGQPLLILGAEPAAIASYKQAVSALALAQSERSRLAQMLEQHLATRDQVAQAAKAVSDAQANLDVLKSAGGDSAGQTLKAGFDGIVSALPVATGARVPANAPLIALERSTGLLAAVGVEPSQRARVAAGQTARIEPLESGAQAQDGVVQAVGGMLDPATRMVPVLVRPADGSGLLPGGPVRANVRVGEAAGWLVPRGAVLTDVKGAYVFQTSGGKAVRIDVQLAGTEGDSTVVTGPIDPAHPLVSSGNYQLQDGLAVRTEDASPAGVASR